MFLWTSELLSRAGSVATKATGIWFIFWAIRRKGEFDRELDRTDQVVRWIVVLVSLGLVTYLIGKDSTGIRIVALIIGLGFLCWPNFAYHLTGPFRSRRSENTSVVP